MIRCFLPADRWGAELSELDEEESKHLVSVLRAAPGLRSVARTIPLRWQTRVKNWLNA